MPNPDHRESIQSQWDSLRDKYCQLDVLRAKLDRSIALKNLWDKAFAYGGCKTYFKGGSITYKERFHEVQFVIENANGETKTFELKDVPELLIERLVEVQQNKANCRETVKAIDNFFKWCKFNNKRIERRI